MKWSKFKEQKQLNGTSDILLYMKEITEPLTGN